MSIYEQLLAKNMGVLRIQHTLHLDGKIHVLVKRNIEEHHLERLKDYEFVVHFEGENKT